MRINGLERNNYVNFGAIKVATAKNTIRDITTEIDIYKLQPSDKPFLENFSRAIDFLKLFPKLSTELIARWEKVFNYCVDTAFYNDNTTYLAINNKKPCGILTYINSNPMYLDGICSIPVEINKKVSLVGKTLFYQAFRDAEKNDAKSIVLEAITDGPYDVISKYEKLGFKRIQNAVPNYVQMICNKYKIAEQLKSLPHEIDYVECAPEKVNLNKFLS